MISARHAAHCCGCTASRAGSVIVDDARENLERAPAHPASVGCRPGASRIMRARVSAAVAPVIRFDSA
jgi:hypothetical protein